MEIVWPKSDLLVVTHVQYVIPCFTQAGGHSIYGTSLFLRTCHKSRTD